jgi:hypothetical protein
MLHRPEVVESVLAWTGVKTPNNGATPGIGARKDGNDYYKGPELQLNYRYTQVPCTRTLAS